MLLQIKELLGMTFFLVLIVEVLTWLIQVGNHPESAVIREGLVSFSGHSIRTKKLLVVEKYTNKQVFTTKRPALKGLMMYS